MSGTATARLDARGLSALVRPRILLLVLVQTAAGFALAVSRAGTVVDWLALAAVLAGTTLISAAGCALNHYLERDADRRMERTRWRPLVTGALSERQLLVGALAILVLGLGVLLLGAGPAPAAIEAVAAVLYLGVYTPLKRHTSSNTWVGAIPGALPLVAGAAAGGPVDGLVLVAAGVVFLWQLPHFFAIASLYREEYRAGGLRVLSGEDPEDRLLRWQLPLQVMSVVLLSLLPLVWGEARATYALVLVAVSVPFLAAAFAFRRDPGPPAARRVVLASVAWLPLVLVALVADVACTEAGTGDDGTGLPVLSELPDFELVTQDGTPFRRADLLGQVWVADFIFTSCSGICLGLSEAMVGLQERELPARFLSITVDPANDRPEALAAYRAKWGGEAGRWTLLTGEPAALAALARDGFRLPAGVAGQPEVEGMPALFHSGRFALLDARGRLRGTYEHDDALERERLVADIGRLAATAP